MQNMPKTNNKDTRTKSMTSFRGIHCKTQTNCHTPPQRPHCSLPTSNKKIFTRQRVRVTRVKSCIYSFVLYFDLLNLQVINKSANWTRLPLGKVSLNFSEIKYIFHNYTQHNNKKIKYLHHLSKKNMKQNVLKI